MSARDPTRLGPVEMLPAGMLPAGVLIERLDGGVIKARSLHALPPHAERVGDVLEGWAERAPDRVLVAERDGAGWRRVTYAQALDAARRIAGALSGRGLSAERPVAILSGNGVDHALLALGAMLAGVPYAPVSTAYSLISTDFAKLRHILGLLTPGLVFAGDADRYAPAIAAAAPAGAEVLHDLGPLLAHAPRAGIATGPDTVAKLLFTSGSTGRPKGVVTTHRMLCANQAMIAACLPFLRDAPPVLMDWLPWSHTFGGSHNFGIALFNGGTLHIDDGRPTGAAMQATVRNLCDVAPTIHFNVPKGYEELLAHLRADRALRLMFFSRLRALFTAGAALAPHVADGLREVAIETVGEAVPLLTSLGSTETAPFALFSHDATSHPAHVGTPAPGLELKLVPEAGKLEARVRGPAVTPGYWREPELTRGAFDDEGWYRLGDALRFADPADPQAGFCFDGRIAEDFKLATGTWVSVGPLRASVVAALAPVARDAVIAGHDRDEVCAVIVPDLAACRALHPDLDESGPLCAHAGLLGFVRDRLRLLAEGATGSSSRVARALVLTAPLSVDAGEATDKGSVNQRAVLRARPELIDALYGGPSPHVVGLDAG